MAPYALAQLTAPRGKRLISLSQNESLRPPSPQALRAAADTLAAGHLYPDPDWKTLRTGLAELHSLPADDILCGSGSMQLIACLTQAFADPRNAVLTPRHAYPFFRTAAQLAQARLDTAPEDNGVVSVDALLAALRPDTRIVLVANPGNPTGTRLPRSEVLRLRSTLPGNVLLVIDEAYGEFADHLDPPLFDLVQGGDTVILRSFSKAYGLAGLRVGWGLFPPAIADQMRKVMPPNNIPATGQAAATAALADQAYMRNTCTITARLRDAFITRLQGAGATVAPSFTNFALIRFASAHAADRADAALRAEGIFLRPQSGADLPHCLRATIADADLLNHAADLLEHHLNNNKGQT